MRFFGTTIRKPFMSCTSFSFMIYRSTKARSNAHNYSNGLRTIGRNTNTDAQAVESGQRLSTLYLLLFSMRYFNSSRRVHSSKFEPRTVHWLCSSEFGQWMHFFSNFHMNIEMMFFCRFDFFFLHFSSGTFAKSENLSPAPAIFLLLREKMNPRILGKCSEIWEIKTNWSDSVA